MKEPTLMNAEPTPMNEEPTPINDAFAQLMDDHREVEQLFAKFEESGDYGIAMDVCKELTLHALVEEELIYPLYRAKVELEGGTQAEAEHQEVKAIIGRIENLEPDDEAVTEAMGELKACVTHHVEEEENELFPKMEEAIPGLTASLGQDVRMRKAAYKAQMTADQAQGLDPSVTGVQTASNF